MRKPASQGGKLAGKGAYLNVSDRRLQVQLAQEAKIASDFPFIRAIFAVDGLCQRSEAPRVRRGVFAYPWRLADSQQGWPRRGMLSRPRRPAGTLPASPRLPFQSKPARRRRIGRKRPRAASAGHAGQRKHGDREPHCRRIKAIFVDEKNARALLSASQAPRANPARSHGLATCTRAFWRAFHRSPAAETERFALCPAKPWRGQGHAPRSLRSPTETAARLTAITAMPEIRP